MTAWAYPEMSPTNVARVMPVPNSGCWIWLGSINDFGYGKLTLNSKSVRAHRLSWEQHRGPIPDGLWVLHKCDVPCCVNPDHLFLGTRVDNVRDMFQKGRGGREKMVATRRARGIGRGEGNPNAKLTEAQAREIYLSREMGTVLARRFGISQAIVSEIRHRKRWPTLHETRDENHD